MCREEALGLTKLKPQLESANMRLLGVVHEDLGVNEFKEYFGGEIFLDNQVRSHVYYFWTDILFF